MPREVVHTMKMRQGVHRRAEGQILVLFAGGLAVFLILIGLVIDGGMAFLSRRDAQNSADLAALAGTKVVADLYVKGASPISVYQAIDASALGNNCLGAGDTTPCTWTASYVDVARNVLGAVTAGSALPSGTFGVQVHVTRLPVTFIAGPAMRLLGQDPIDAWNVQTVATALTYQAEQVAAAGGMLPIGWRAPEDFTYNQVYRFTTGGLDVPGNFGWLSWTGDGSTQTMNGWVCAPSNPEINLPDYIEGNTGASNSSTIRDCIQRYIDQKIPVLIPVIGEADPPSACPDGAVTGNGSSSQYCIVGVVSVILTDFILTTTNGQPVIKEIEGFVQQVYAFQPGVVPADAIGVAPPKLDSKFYYLGLVQ
jgi:Flp pilus assembly protein TadG